MPQIPVYEEKVGLDSGGTPTPQLQGPMQSASGMNVAAATAGLGKSIEGEAGSVAHLVAYKQKLDSQEKVDNLHASFAADLQDKLHGKDGLLLRQADAAKGITSGTPDMPPGYQGPMQPGQIKYKDSFDGFADDLKQKYMSQATTGYEQKMLNHAIDANTRVARNAVIDHEGQQAQIARGQAHEAAIGGLENTAADAVKPDEITNTKGDGLLDRALVQREQALRDAGHSDQSVIDAVKQQTANKFADVVVHANLERDPEKAQAMLDAMKGKISGPAAAQLQDHVDGKMTSIRSGAINQQIAEDPKSRNDDQTLNLGFVEKRAAELASSRPPGEQKKLVMMAKEQASMQNSAIAQQKQKATSAVLDGFTVMRDKNVPFPEAEKTFMGSDTSMFGQHEIDQLREQGVKIYQRDPDALKERLKTMNDDQQAGYANAQDIIKTKYALKSKALLEGEEYKMTPGRILLRQLDKAAPSMSGPQMVRWINEQLKDVPTKPGYLAHLPGGPYFTGLTPKWQVDAKKDMGQ